MISESSLTCEHYFLTILKSLGERAFSDKLLVSVKQDINPGESMVTSIILMNVERLKINDVAEQLEATPGISEVYSVSGNYDLIAVVRVATNNDLATLVTEKMHSIDAILKTETMLAFKAYSRHDLESMFSIGM